MRGSEFLSFVILCLLWQNRLSWFSSTKAVSRGRGYNSHNQQPTPNLAGTCRVFVGNRGNRFHVFHEGDGPPFVFLKGFRSINSMWNHQAGGIQKRPSGHHSRSARLRSVESDHPSRIARRSRRRRGPDSRPAHIKEPVTLCGLSMGRVYRVPVSGAVSGSLRQIILCDT